MSTVLATLGVAALLIVGVLSALMLSMILRMRFVPPRTEAMPQLPDEVEALLAPGVAQLRALGFVPPGAGLRQFHQRKAGDELPQHALVLLHAEGPVAAYVYQAPLPDRGRPWTIFFASRTQDGHTLVTRNRASVGGPLPTPDTSTQDCWARDWPTVWQAHKRRMKAMQPKTAGWQWLSPAEWIEAGAASEKAGFEVRAARGDLRPAGDGSWRFTLRCALGMLLRAWLTVRASSRGMVGDTPAAAAVQNVEQQVATFERETSERRNGGWSQRAKWLLFFITAAAAAASFGLSMDLGTVPALVAVLLFHELGHFAAMRWAGYRDLKVFFLPFLGAAVSGRHDHPTATQELIVLFAGPVPGLLLGLGALWWGLPDTLPFGDFWHNCVLLAVTINAFNLLPIHPLDGGKIFEILLLGRWPWLAFTGRVLGIAAFAGIALTMDSPIGRGVLWALVALMLLGLAHQRDEARLAAALRARGAFGGQPRSAALQALFGAMQQLGLGHKPWPNQRLLADALLPAMARASMSRTGRAGGLLVYGFFLALPVLALVVSIGFMPRVAAPATAAAQPAAAADPNGPGSLNALFVDLKTRFDAEPDARRRWALLVDEFGSQAELIASNAPGQLPAAEALLRDAERVAAEQPDAASARARLALWQAHATADDERRRQRLLELSARYDDAATAPADKEVLANASLAWLYEGRAAEPALRARVIERALAQVPVSSPSRWPLQDFRADQLLAQGEGDAALRETRAWFESQRVSAEPGAAERAATLLVDVRLALQGPAAALQELETLLPVLDALPKDRWQSGPGLRRHGMLLAEVSGRTDWQRAQVRLMPPPAQAEEGLPWWMRLLVRSQQRGPGWMELEYRHWQGDAEGAAEVAQSLKKLRPGAAVPATVAPTAAEVGPLAAARQRVAVDARVAVARRYGLLKS